MKQKVKEIILENQQLKFNFIVKRLFEVPLNSGLIISVIGSRRSGKTYLMYDLIKTLLESGVSRERVVFINFEDERLQFQQQDMDLILQAYQELYPDVPTNEVYFFFDEIQNVDGWERFVRRMFDTKTRNIYITGSNSKVLSTEIATELRGRTISFTVFPYSFKEYLWSQGVSIDYKLASNRAKILHYGEKYLFNGGFPELVQLDKSLKVKALQQYFNVMIYRDIVERYNVSNPNVLKYFIKKVFASVSFPLSINKIYNDLKSMGYKISNKYLYEYMDYCNAVFLTQGVNKFNFSEIKQEKSDKKVYVIDNGLLSSIDFSISENRGKLFENMVAMEFLKSGYEIFYYKETYECDFVIRKNGELAAIQACWSLKESETRQRELRGLFQACRYLQKSEGIILTFDEEGELVFESVRVRLVPFYKYFL